MKFTPIFTKMLAQKVADHKNGCSKGRLFPDPDLASPDHDPFDVSKLFWESILGSKMAHEIRTCKGTGGTGVGWGRGQGRSWYTLISDRSDRCQQL